MQERNEAVEKIISSYQYYYNINRIEDRQPIVARCDYFVENESHFLFRKARLWTAEQEQFLYLLDVENLDLETFETMNNYILSDGMDRLHVGPGHMSSEIVPVYICSGCDSKVYDILKGSAQRKSFRFTLHGWMDFYPVVVNLGKESADAPSAGKEVVKSISKILMFNR